MLNSLTHLAFIGPGGAEFLVVMLVLLLMFGAKDAPRIFRKLNEMLNQVRNTADSFKREIMYSDLKTESPDDTFSDTDEHDDEYYDEDHVEDEEQDYSDETFRNLEKDLEDAEVEEAAEPEVSKDEDADAPKT